jgi:hypothetical protein
MRAIRTEMSEPPQKWWYLLVPGEREREAMKGRRPRPTA